MADNNFWRGFTRGILWPVNICDQATEKSCHWFQRMTGLTNYWVLGKECIVVSFTVIGEYMIRGVGMKPNWFTSAGFGAFSGLKFLGYVVIIQYLCVGAYYWKIKEEKAYERLELGLANVSKKTGFKLWRLWLLLMCWMDLYLLSICIYTFLDACDPLPPCKGKVREFWENRNKKLVPIKVEN